MATITLSNLKPLTGELKHIENLQFEVSYAFTDENSFFDAMARQYKGRFVGSKGTIKSNGYDAVFNDMFIIKYTNLMLKGRKVSFEIINT